MTTAENIRRLRRAARMSMESLGEHLGVSRQTVFRYENGTFVNIPRDKIEKMAERVYAAQLLMEGKTYNQVMEQSDISSATLSRVSRCVQYGKGYSQLLKK